MPTSIARELAFWAAIVCAAIAGPMVAKIAGAHIKNKALQTFLGNA